VKQSRDFEDFYAASYGKLTALVAAIIGDWHEADDIAQEAFARALARWPRVSGYELPEAWVRQVALRLAIDSSRRIRRDQFQPSPRPGGRGNPARHAGRDGDR
jgi:RNA polymerase sigma-70 factor, ECF subfamily